MKFVFTETRGKILRITRVFLALSASLITSAWSFNHPEIQWKSIETAHFIFHYYDNTEPLVGPAIAVAEEVFPVLVQQYGSIDYKKINIALGDYDDASNGFADWLGNGIEIWTPDLLFPFRGSPTWLRNVITHELTHIVTMRKAQGLQMIATNVSVGIHNPGFDAVMGKTLPMMDLFPSWFAEGLAQTGSTRCGNDCWDNRRDMILRCASLDHSMLTLDQMGVFASDQLGNEQVYNQGFSLIMHIEQAVGSDELLRLLRRSNSPLMMTAAVQPAMCESIAGRNLEFYYKQWRDSLLNAARRAVPVAATTEIGVVWQEGRLNQQPHTASRTGLQGWLTGNNDDSHRTDLVVMRKGDVKPLLIVKHAEVSWDFNTRGDCVYFIKSYDPGEHGSYLNELYRCNVITRKVEQLTRGGRIYACAVSPNDDKVAVVRFRSGRFSLELFDPQNRTFRVIDAGVPGNSIVALDFDPADPGKIVAECIIAGRSRLYLFDTGSGTSLRVSSGLGQEETPHFSADGQRIYYTADYDGIFNIYSIKVDGSDLQRHTSVIGGAFQPVLDADGTKLLFSDYTSRGYRIVETQLKGEPFSVPTREQCYFKPLAGSAPGFSFGEGRSYTLRMLRATWESAVGIDVFNNGDGSRGIQAGISILRSQSDALGKFNYFLGAGLGGGIASSGMRTVVSTECRDLQRESAVRFDRFCALVDSAAGIDKKTFLVKLQPFVAGNGKIADNPGLNATGSGSVPQMAVQPQCGFVLKRYGPTISSKALLSTVSLLPYLLKSESDIAWQTGRGAIAGASFSADVFLVKYMTESLGKNDTAIKKIDDSLHIPKAGASIPLWFNWQHAGYYNQDVQHNYNDLWQAALTITPSTTAGWNYPVSDSAKDSLFLVKGISGKVELMHGFPLTKYAGLPVAIGIGFSRYAIPVNGTILDSFPLAGNSDLYVSSQATLSCHFPIFRTIKSGRRLFYDALYGRIGYYFSATANRSFLVKLQNSGNRWPDVFNWNADVPYKQQGFHASHLLFFTAEVNNIAEFLFPGEISVTGVTDVVNGGSGFYFTAQF